LFATHAQADDLSTGDSKRVVRSNPDEKIRHEDFLYLNSFSAIDLWHMIGVLYGRFFASTTREVLSRPQGVLEMRAPSTMEPVQGPLWPRSVIVLGEEEY
jgi:hypothetical protein